MSGMNLVFILFPTCMYARNLRPVQDFEEILRSHESGLRIHVQTISREFK